MQDTLSGVPHFDEIRNEPRKPIRKRARMMMDGGSMHGVMTVDISMKGLGVVAESPLPVGSRCAIEFQILFHGQPKQVRLRGQILYSILKGMDGFRTGVRLEQADPENFQYLHSLLS